MSNNKDFKVKNGIQPTAYHEAVGTVVSGSVGYNLAGASYDSVSFSVAAQDTLPRKITFNTDGTKMYMLGASNGAVYQYSLSTAFDVSTASYDSVSFNVGGLMLGPFDVTFNSNGTKMYIVSFDTDLIYQFTLSTAFDLITTSYDSVSFSVASQDAIPRGLTFNNDGTKMYVVGDTNNSIYQYSLSTAFDLNTVSYDSVSFSVASQDTGPSDIAFNTNGSKMYVVGFAYDSVYQYNLTTAFDLSTASYDSVSFSVTGQDTTPYGLAFSSAGTKMYILGGVSDTIYQYSTALNTASLDLSTGSVFEITPTSDVQVTLTNPAASGTSSGATLLLTGAGTTGYDLSNASYDGISFDVESSFAGAMYFKSDGLTFYVMQAGSGTAYQYSMSTAWDLSTASYASKSHDFSPENGFSGRGFWLKSDGTKLYSVDELGSNIAQYSLSTAWDLSTTTYDSVFFSNSSQLTDAQDVTFSADGTSMYILGYSTLYQYTLSTAWSISTSSYASKSLSVTSQDSAATSIYFKPDGKTMYIVGASSDSIHQYTLSTAWDISTASYDNVSFNISSEEPTPRGLAFKSDDGTKVYYAGNRGFVYQASALTPASITYDTSLQWSGGTAPTAPAIGDTDVLTFNTTDGGTTYKSAQAVDGAK